MTKNSKIALLAILPFAAGSMSASAALIAGWETWADTAGDINPATQFATNVTATADGTAESGGIWFLFNNDTVANGASSDGTFGTLGIAEMSTVSGQGYSLSSGYDGFIDFTITNGSTNTIELTSFNFDAGAFRVRAATDWELSVVAGSSITPGSVQSSGGPVTVASAPIVDDYDVALTGLADNDLEPAGVVTFRLNFTGGSAPGTGSGGHHLFLDNVGVFGDAIPEPSSALFLGLSGLALMVRRRK